LARQGRTEPFIVRNHPKIEDGLFRFDTSKEAEKVKGFTVKNGRKKHWQFKKYPLIRLQYFKKHPNPEKVEWMKQTRDAVLGSVNLDRMWGDALRKQMAYRKR